MPIEVAAQRYPHGTAARYKLGHCRCEPCRAALREYENARVARNYTRLPYRVTHVPGRGTGAFSKPYYAVVERATKAVALRIADRSIAFAVRDQFNAEDGNLSGRQLIDASPVREHLHALSAAGVGRRAIQEHSGVSGSVIARLRSGEIKKTRRSTAAKLFAVDVAGAARERMAVDSAAVWSAVDRMAAAGFTTWARAVVNPAVQLHVNTHVLDRYDATPGVRPILRKRAAGSSQTHSTVLLSVLPGRAPRS